MPRKLFLGVSVVLLLLTVLMAPTLVFVDRSLENFAFRVSQDLLEIPYSVTAELTVDLQVLRNLVSLKSFVPGDFQTWKAESYLGKSLDSLIRVPSPGAPYEILFQREEADPGTLPFFWGRYGREIGSEETDLMIAEFFRYDRGYGAFAELSDGGLLILLFDSNRFFSETFRAVEEDYLPEGMYLDNWRLAVVSDENEVFYPADPPEGIVTEGGSLFSLPFIEKTPYIVFDSNPQEENPALGLWRGWIEERALRVSNPDEWSETYSPEDREYYTAFVAMIPTWQPFDQWSLLLHARVYTLSAALVLLIVGIILVLAALFSREKRLRTQEAVFLSSVTHELKTPLFAISSAGENLAEGVVSNPDQVAQYGRILKNQSRRLLGMVDDVLFFVRIQNRMKLGGATDLSTLIREILPSFELRTAGTEIEFVTWVGESDPVRGPRDALRLVVENLLNNAVIHGGSGGWVRLVYKERLLVIEDRGPGIPRRERSRVMRSFVRGARAEALQKPGSGLGLSLVKQILRGIGGKIRLIDRSPQGLRVEFHFAPGEVYEENSIDRG